MQQLPLIYFILRGDISMDRIIRILKIIWNSILLLMTTWFCFMLVEFLPAFIILAVLFLLFLGGSSSNTITVRIIRRWWE
jgi:hypothetical protein